MAVKTTCSFPGCNRPRARSSNYCHQHSAQYQRQWRQNAKLGAIRAGLDLAIDFLDQRVGEQILTGHKSARLLRQLASDYAPRERIFNYRVLGARGPAR